MYIAFTWGRKANFGQVMPVHCEKSDRFIWRLLVADGKSSRLSGASIAALR